MKFSTIRVSNFLSFCETEAEIELGDIAYLIDPDRSEKQRYLKPYDDFNSIN